MTVLHLLFLLASFVILLGAGRLPLSGENVLNVRILIATAAVCGVLFTSPPMFNQDPEALDVSGVEDQ